MNIYIPKKFAYAMIFIIIVALLTLSIKFIVYRHQSERMSQVVRQLLTGAEGSGGHLGVWPCIEVGVTDDRKNEFISQVGCFNNKVVIAKYCNTRMYAACIVDMEVGTEDWLFFDRELFDQHLAAIKIERARESIRIKQP